MAPRNSLDVPGMKDHAISSNEALDLPEMPKKIAIYGSGYIALEFAGIFNGLGARTHLIYRSDLPLRGFDDDVRAHMATALTDRGIILHPKTTIDQVTAENSGKQAHLSDGSRLAVDQIMAATGRSRIPPILALMIWVSSLANRAKSLLMKCHKRTCQAFMPLVT